MLHQQRPTSLRVVKRALQWSCVRAAGKAASSPRHAHQPACAKPALHGRARVRALCQRQTAWRAHIARRSQASFFSLRRPQQQQQQQQQHNALDIALDICPPGGVSSLIPQSMAKPKKKRPGDDVYSSSSARSFALALVTRTFSCAARSTISFRLRALTSWAISAQYFRLCINKSSSSLTLFTRNL